MIEQSMHLQDGSNYADKYAKEDITNLIQAFVDKKISLIEGRKVGEFTFITLGIPSDFAIISFRTKDRSPAGYMCVSTETVPYLRKAPSYVQHAAHVVTSWLDSSFRGKGIAKILYEVARKINPNLGLTSSNDLGTLSCALWCSIARRIPDLVLFQTKINLVLDREDCDFSKAIPLVHGKPITSYPEDFIFYWPNKSNRSQSMATTFKNIQVRAADVSGQNYRFVEEINRTLDDIQEQLDNFDAFLAQQKKVTSGGLNFTIDQTQVMQSPSPQKPATLKVSTKDLEALKKNYDLLRYLHDTLQTLDATEAKIKVAFQDDSKEAEKTRGEIERMRKGIKQRLSDAAAFLQEKATAQAPREFTKFVQTVNNIVEKSIAYEDSKSFIYLFEADGQLAFAHYLQLMMVTDEDGKTYSDLIIVTSMKAVSPPEFYLNTMTEAEVPSSALFVKEVKNSKDIIKALHTLLVMDNFDNSLGNLPVDLLLNPKDVRKELFNEAEHISSLKVDDETGYLTFWLKPTVKDKSLVYKIANSLNLDMQGICKKTHSKLRMDIQSSSKGQYRVIFYMKKPEGSPQATSDDLEFLKDRFGLDDGALKKILKVVNAGSLAYAMSIKASGKPSKKPADIEKALKDLNRRIHDKNEEFPDACWNVASQHNVDYEALHDAYDDQH